MGIPTLLRARCLHDLVFGSRRFAKNLELEFEAGSNRGRASNTARKASASKGEGTSEACFQSALGSCCHPHRMYILIAMEYCTTAQWHTLRSARYCPTSAGAR